MASNFAELSNNYDLDGQYSKIMNDIDTCSNNISIFINELKNNLNNNFNFEEIVNKKQVLSKINKLKYKLNTLSGNVNTFYNSESCIYITRLNDFKKMLEFASYDNVQYDTLIKIHDKKNNKGKHRYSITNNKTKTISKNVNMQKVSSTMYLPAISVKNEIEIPNVDLYYMENASQFGFKINGVLFRGNIGNIISKSQSTKKVIPCSWKESCDKKDLCQYYHDPKYVLWSTDIQNFTEHSYIYTPEPKNRQNRSNRHIGSRDNIEDDIGKIDNDESNRLIAQITHDVLVSLCIHTYANIRNPSNR